jgi:hypothetical protein
LPHLKSSYAKYQSDPNVAFLLVSLDKDPNRLRRYLDEMQFPFPVARAAQEHVQQAIGIDDVPATFYVDPEGIVRYEVKGVESHGDSASRVAWFVDQLKNRH